MDIAKIWEKVKTGQQLKLRELTVPHLPLSPLLLLLLNNHQIFSPRNMVHVTVGEPHLKLNFSTLQVKPPKSCMYKIMYLFLIACGHCQGG